MTLAQVHFFAACFWLGLLAAESVMELHPASGQPASAITTIHKWIDLLFEGPVILLLLITGGILLARNWPAPPLLLAKAGLGLVAVCANLYCMPLVLLRAMTDDADRTVALSRRIKLTGAGIPFAVAAFVIGATYLHRN